MKLNGERVNFHDQNQVKWSFRRGESLKVIFQKLQNQTFTNPL